MIIKKQPVRTLSILLFHDFSVFAESPVFQG
jgi:hypothetical protein